MKPDKREWEEEFDKRYSPKYFWNVGVSNGLQFNPNNEYRDVTKATNRDVILQKKAKEIELYQKDFIHRVEAQAERRGEEKVVDMLHSWCSEKCTREYNSGKCTNCFCVLNQALKTINNLEPLTEE